MRPPGPFAARSGAPGELLRAILTATKALEFGKTLSSSSCAGVAEYLNSGDIEEAVKSAPGQVVTSWLEGQAMDRRKYGVYRTCMAK